jgi:CRISPR-associated protein Csb2
MPLVLEIEHLLGVAFAAQSPASPVPDWPPQPDRVFSALVAAWSGRGERADERRALEWLEAQPAPDIASSGGYARTPATVFVPPNDPQTGRVGDRTVMPAFRRRQQRRFPAFRPDDPVIQLIWRDVEVDSNMVSTLNALAADTPSIGHPSSLTRCRFRTDGASDQTTRSQRRVYRGRLAELESAYARFVKSGRKEDRPNPGESVPLAAAVAREPTRSVFANRWLILEHVEGEMPDLRAAAVIGKALRGALMSGYRKTGHEAAIPLLVSGHAADGSPSAEPHLAIVPLAFFGPQFADGRLFGFALVPPGNGELLEHESFRTAVRAIAPWKEDPGRRELSVTAHGFNIVFTPSPQRELHFLDPAPYVAFAKTWATCTPIVLDRHLKAKGNAERDAEVAGLLREACANIGLPPPVHVAVSKHSAVIGAPSAYPSGHAPRWIGWRLPNSLASRQLTHALLQFDEPVRGPVILGAGRFAGLGLGRALDPQRR